jgi:hypothetical protein
MLPVLQTTVAEILAAMIPCSRLYGYLGCSLAGATRHLAKHAYSEWVETYSGAEYLVSTVGPPDCECACVCVKGTGGGGGCCVVML